MKYVTLNNGVKMPMAEIRELDQEKRYYTSTPELLKKYATMVPPVDDQK